MDYLSFDLRLGEWNALSHSGLAEVLQSPAGEGERYPFLLDVDTAACTERMHRTSNMAVELGRKLAESVLSRESLTLWYESYQIARERNRGLRLRLHVESWELSLLPWELLYDSQRQDFLVFDPSVSVVRYLRVHAAPPALRQSQTLRVLAVVASPNDLQKLDWQRELRVLHESLQELTSVRQVQVILCERTTQEKLHIALLENAPDVVHFIGHGAYDPRKRQGMVFLEDDEGRSAPLEAPEAARILRRYGVNLVVLNACETGKGEWAGLAPALVRAEIPAVVAMQWPVEDRAAIRFSRLFYKALSLGKTIDECVAEGRVGASAVNKDPNDWAAPVLFLRSLSGRLWTNEVARVRERKETSTAPQEPTLRSPGVGNRPAASERDTILFKTRGPLLAATDGDLLVERQELRRALRLAQQPSVTQYIAFLSARQTGKTTMLLRLMDLLQESYACVFIDLSVLRAQDARACFRFVAFRLMSEFRAMLGNGSLLPEMPPIESAVDFLEFLRGLADAVPMPRIVLLLDEVGALSPQASDSFFNTLRTIFTQGRGLNRPLSKYLFVFSGAVDLYALTFGTNSPLNICEKLYLRDLELSDVHKIVAQFQRLGVNVPPAAATHINDLTGGHPYLTMRLCALLEHAQVKELSTEKIDLAAEQMLAGDDNIQHVVHELEQRPAERRRLHSILVEGRQVPFSRNDPVLASLEMIGAIRAAQPCVIRNSLYARALRQYYAQSAGTLAQPAPSSAPASDVDEELAMYARLQTLRAEALHPQGTYHRGRAWEAFAAALFSMVPAFSIYPDMQTEGAQSGIVLAINGDAPGGQHWNLYAPAILVEYQDLRQTAPESMVAGVLSRANRHNIKLVFVMTSRGAEEAAKQPAGYSGTRGDVAIVLLDDEQVRQIIDEHRDLDTFLRNKVLETRLRQV